MKPEELRWQMWPASSAGPNFIRKSDRPDAIEQIAGSIVRGGTLLRTMVPGDFFGEIALLDEGPRTATATTTASSKLLVLAHREFHSLMDRFPAIRTCVLEVLAKRIRQHEPEAAH